MGVYYFYVNETKSQYFCIDPARINVKQHALGRNIGSRALSYLLLENNSYYTSIEPHKLIGSWIGDRFFVTGDDYCEQFNLITENYENIAQAVFELIVTVNPWDLLEYEGIDWLLFMIEHNGEFVTITPELRKHMSHEFRFANHQNPSDDLKRIIAALRQ